MLDDALGNSSTQKKLDHLTSCNGNDLLQCAVLHLVLWNELHSVNSFSHHSRNRGINGLFNDALDTRISVGQLILVVSDRIPVAGDMMSRNVVLVLRLANILDAIRLLAVIFTLLRLEQGYRLIDQRDDFRESTIFPLITKEINFRFDAELLGVWKDRRSSIIARLLTAAVL